MRKNIFLIPVLFCLSVMPLHADMTPYLNEFDSGSIDLKVKFVMDGFYGARGDALRARNGIHPGFPPEFYFI